MTKKALATAVIAAYLSACTTTAPILAPPDQIGTVLKAGDRAVLLLRSGQTRELLITRTTAREVCGEQECVPVEEIASAERREISVLKIAAAVLLLGSVIALVKSTVYLPIGWPAP